MREEKASKAEKNATNKLRFQANFFISFKPWKKIKYHRTL